MKDVGFLDFVKDAVVKSYLETNKDKLVMFLKKLVFDEQDHKIDWKYYEYKYTVDCLTKSLRIVNSCPAIFNFVEE